jgi:hypothetical protein
MAKAAQQSSADESIMGYFRPFFEANPELLKERKNDQLYDQWLKDHPGKKVVPPGVKNGLSNLKSTLRTKLGIRKRRGKRRRKGEATAVAAAAPVKKAPRGATGALDRLEEQIDECLSLARSVDQEGLEDVIGLLRRARNRVVVQTAQ